MVWTRDTDKDWRTLGRDNPYWGVLTAPQFDRRVITGDDIEQLYRTGHADVERLTGHISECFGVTLQPERALDFGCGVGRVTLAMANVAKEVVGLDISEGMLEKARSRPARNVRFLAELPNGRFDWIHSVIVFQHIPPKRGMAILKTLLDRLTPGGWITLHFTFAHDASMDPKSWTSRLADRAKRVLRPSGAIHMYDYDLGQIVSDLYRAGISRLSLVPTDHGGHVGAYIIGRKDQGTVAPRDPDDREGKPA